MRALNAETLPLIAYAGGLASILWVRGVQTLGPSRRAIFMNLLQVLTALGADRAARRTRPRLPRCRWWCRACRRRLRCPGSSPVMDIGAGRPGARQM